MLWDMLQCSDGRRSPSNNKRHPTRLESPVAHLEILGSVARELQHLRGQVLCSRHQRTSGGTTKRAEGRGSQRGTESDVKLCQSFTNERQAVSASRSARDPAMVRLSISAGVGLAIAATAAAADLRHPCRADMLPLQAVSGESLNLARGSPRMAAE